MLAINEFEILMADEAKGLICATVPNFMSIGETVTEISQFSPFQDGGRPPSWFLKSSNFETESC